MILVLLLLLSSARAEDTGASDARASGEAPSLDTPGSSHREEGFLSSPAERRALIDAISALAVVLLGGGAVGGAAAYRRRTGLPASSVEEINDPRLGELLSLVRLQGERIAALESERRNDPTLDLLVEQQHQIDRALNQTATMVELMYDSLALAPKLAAARPEEVSV